MDFLATLSLILMTFVLSLEIIGRYCFNSPLSWSLPLSLFLFVWYVWLGGAAGVREERQMRLEFAERHLPDSIRRFLLPGINVISFLLFLLVAVKGVALVGVQSSSLYAVMPLSRAWLFLAAPLVGAVMAVYCLRVLLRQIRHFFSRPRQEGRPWTR